DAFRSMGLDRRQALWDSRALRQAPDLPLFTFAEARDEGTEAQPVALPQTPLSEHVVSDYQTLRLSLKAHPLEFLRGHYDHRRFARNDRLATMKSGNKVAVSGLVLVRQRPGTASGVCFITLEDETGIANLVVWPKVFEQYRKVVMTARLMEARGYVQTDENVVHVVVQELVDATGTLAALSDDLLRAEVARADHVVKPLPVGLHRHPRNVSIIPKSRDFH
ncbi:MAG: error-prone DNA polymerase, partial [Rhodospirillaceae bacterium]|nr:error-prone DNA polymerase [Rhodospirillaceae bacterium]